MRLSERRRLGYYEAHAKKYFCRDVLIVGAQSDHIVTKMLASHIGMKSLSVIAQWGDPEKIGPIAKLNQHAAMKRLANKAKSYPKFCVYLETADVLEGVEKLTEEGALFDLVILSEAVQPHNLAQVGMLAVSLVRTGGWLIGSDHRDPGVRGVLDAAVGPKRWQAYPREGVWGIRIERKSHKLEAVELPPLPSDESASGNVAEREPEAEPEQEGSEGHSADPLVAEDAMVPRRRGRPKKQNAAPSHF